MPARQVGGLPSAAPARTSALHDVDVELRDRRHQWRRCPSMSWRWLGDVLAIDGQRDEVAGVIDAHEAAARRDGIEDAADVRGGDVFQLHDLQAGADALASSAGTNNSAACSRARWSRRFKPPPLARLVQPTYFPALFSALLMIENVVFNWVPRLLITAMIATEIPAAISPYSMAVAPDSSRTNRANASFTSTPQVAARRWLDAGREPDDRGPGERTGASGRAREIGLPDRRREPANDSA